MYLATKRTHVLHFKCLFFSIGALQLLCTGAVVLSGMAFSLASDNWRELFIWDGFFSSPCTVSFQDVNVLAPYARRCHASLWWSWPNPMQIDKHIDMQTHINFYPFLIGYSSDTSETLDRSSSLKKPTSHTSNDCCGTVSCNTVSGETVSCNTVSGETVSGEEAKWGSQQTCMYFSTICPVLPLWTTYNNELGLSGNWHNRHKNQGIILTLTKNTSIFFVPLCFVFLVTVVVFTPWNKKRKPLSVSNCDFEQGMWWQLGEMNWFHRHSGHLLKLYFPEKLERLEWKRLLTTQPQIVIWKYALVSRNYISRMSSRTGHGF